MKNIVLTFCGLLMMSSIFYSTSADAFTRRSSSNPFYIEPYAGYFLGDLKSDNFGDGELSSLYAGARLGIETSKGLIFGVDYGQGLGEFDPDNRANGNKGDYEQKDLGAFIGYRILTQVRIYGSYIFKYEAEFDRDNGLPDFEIEGDGFNVGISVQPSSSIKIGLEYQIRNLKKNEAGNSLLNRGDQSTTFLLNLQLPVPMPFNLR